ncbi:MAG: phospholipase D family protein [Gammaproteobacteria bacterium]
MKRVIRPKFVVPILLMLGAAGCATLPDKLPKGPPGKAMAAQASGTLAQLETQLQPKVATNGSGFHLLDSNDEALHWRLALVDSAEHSLDLQYYFWLGDASGDLLMKHVMDAADRGVKVRLILDDISTWIEKHGKLKVRDWEVSVLNAHPNMELRLFNAWRSRSMPGRVIEFLRHMGRANQRMHNKLLIADNRAAIMGGRNIGNEYFGYSQESNFRDLDVLGVGPVSRQASDVFDRFWNSSWVVQVKELKLHPQRRDVRAQKRSLVESVGDSTVQQRFPLARGDWHADIADLTASIEAGQSRVVTDVPAADKVRHRMPEAIRQLMASAQKELLIDNAYVIPEKVDIGLFRDLTARGVKIKLLTNSLASQDVPAVNSHYKQWRKRLIEAGVELYESRADAAIQPLVADTPPTHAEFMGLHVKAIVVDGTRVFVGSMNLDRRSNDLNTEMGVLVESDSLGVRLASLMERDMRPENAWRLSLNSRGRVEWTAEDQVLTRQPARSGLQRLQDLIFMLFPKSLY